MNQKELFSVALKFIALQLLLQCVGLVLQFVLELSIPPMKQLTLFQFSPIGNPIRSIMILFYGIGGSILFTKSNDISNKYIHQGGLKIASNEQVLQLVMAYQGISGIIVAVLGIISMIIYQLPIFDIGYVPAMLNTILLRGGTYILELIVGVLFLLNYIKISRFLVQKIPQKFWGK